MDSVVRSMDDYIRYITPAVFRTHINFLAECRRWIPQTRSPPNPFRHQDESFTRDRFRGLKKSISHLLSMLGLLYFTHSNTIVVPAEN